MLNLNTTESQIELIRKKVIELNRTLASPKIFFEKQQELYNINVLKEKNEEPINRFGLPVSTEAFYHCSNKMYQSSKTEPRILNIGSSGDGNRNLIALNLDLEDSEGPDITYDGKNIPFPDDYFTIVRASHVLEHIKRDELLNTLKEWKRVLHPDGELHIAVPDAEIVFREIISGTTAKGLPSLSNTETTPSLTQIYGLGYDNYKTNKRWRHHVIFDINLLNYFLNNIGLGQTRKSILSDNLAFLCQVKHDSMNHYSHNIVANHKKPVQPDVDILTPAQFEFLCLKFLKKLGTPPNISFIIPVYNEADRLPLFIESLNRLTNRLGNSIEYIFVLNGCSDQSREIIENDISALGIRAILIESNKGINSAIFEGVKARTFDGLIGKLDADTTLHPQTIDLMTMHILSNPELEVVYAEPIPKNIKNKYNEVEHNKSLRSKRVYYHGRTSLFRHNPCKIEMFAENINNLLCEDVLLSYYFAYFKGLNSMAAAAHAYTYSETVENFSGLELQKQRLAQEIRNVHNVSAPFAILDNIFKRDVYSESYRRILKKINVNNVDIKEWKKIRSAQL